MEQSLAAAAHKPVEDGSLSAYKSKIVPHGTLLAFSSLRLEWDYTLGQPGQKGVCLAVVIMEFRNKALALPLLCS